MSTRSLCLVALALLGSGSVPAPAREEPRDVVYVIPIYGPIEPALEYVIRRGVTEADSAKASAIVFKINTDGGTLDAAREIVNLIENISVPTYSLVQEQAFSAGAIIAMATRNIYMEEGSVIGDAMPVMIAPGGQAQDMPEDLQEKTVSAVAALIRSAAEQGGHDKELAEAMVRRDNEYKIGETVICPAGELLTLTNQEAEQIVGEGDEARPLLSAGTVKDFDALLETIGLADAEVIELEVTAIEQLARLIKSLAFLFLAAGLLGIYLEMKTPGIGVPGALGVLSLAIFFFGHHIAGLAGMEEVLLVALGLALIAVEIFVLPGFGFAGFSGLFFLCWGILMAMVQHYPGGSILPEWPQFEIPIVKLSTSILLTFALALLAGRFLPRSSLLKAFRLQEAATTEKGFVPSTHDYQDLIGMSGQAISPLRPAGTAMFNDQRLDVVTDGQYLDKGTKIRIVRISGNHILVEAV